jgi:hypothetical protein
MRTQGTDSNLNRLLGRSSPVCRDICALTLIALLLNVFRLGTKSMVLDESTSVSYARLSFTSLLHVLTGGDPNMALYYVLLNF